MAYTLPDGTKIQTSIRMRDMDVYSIHILPTSLLLKLHSRVEAAYKTVPRYNRFKNTISFDQLILLHIIIANEMDIRQLDHVDEEEFEWSPVSISLPEESLEVETLIDKFIKYSKKVT